MPQWALKSSLLTVDILHYINRYWRRFFFFLSLGKTVISLKIFVDGVYVWIISNMSNIIVNEERIVCDYHGLKPDDIAHTYS